MNQQAVCILLKNMGVGFSEKICVSMCVYGAKLLHS